MTDVRSKAVNSKPAAASGGGKAKAFFKYIGKNKMFCIGMLIVIIAVLSAVLAPVIAPCDPQQMTPSIRLTKPFTDSEHILGRTAMGCKSPFSVMLSASWFSASSSNRLRGCSGSGSISRSGSVELDASLPVSSDRSANRLSSPLPSPPIFFLAIGVPPYRSLFAKNSRANSMYASLPLPFGS